MKITTLLSTITSAAMLFACSEDDKVTFDPAQTKPAVLQTIDEEIVLEESTIADQSFLFKWQKADLGFDAAITYALEMDIEGNDFKNAKVLASTFSDSISVSGENLNLAMAALQLVYEFESNTAQSVQLRVNGKLSDSADPIISNVIATTITPFASKAIPMPTDMYMMGSMCGASGWDWASAITMTPVNQGARGEGKFWTIQYLEAGAEFKFNTATSWDGNDFCGTLTEGSLATIPGNIKVENAGYYQIMVSLSYVDDTKQALNKNVTVIKPEIYLMGECTADGWVESMAANKFTEDAVNKKLVSPALANSANLRMYVKFTGCDWWGSEFNVYDGAIVLRANGGDQAAVAGVAGQVVTLDFTDMTATIE